MQEMTWNPATGQGGVDEQEFHAKMEITTECQSTCDRILRHAWEGHRTVNLEWLRGTTGNWNVQGWHQSIAGHVTYHLFSAGPVAIVLTDEQGPTGWRQCEDVRCVTSANSTACIRC